MGDHLTSIDFVPESMKKKHRYNQTVLFFSYILRSYETNVAKELQGIIISYVVRAQCWVGLRYVFTYAVYVCHSLRCFMVIQSNVLCTIFQSTKLIPRHLHCAFSGHIQSAGPGITG